MRKPQLQLIAHRGNARDYPENTLPALQSAVALGIRFVEFDVQLSGDSVPIVIHDHDLARTAGLPGCVFDMPAAELSKIEVNESERFAGRHSGVRLPLLSHTAAWLARHPQVTAFVEIKRASLRRFGHTEVMQKVLQTVQSIQPHCVVISFDLLAVEQARAAGFKVGWVLSEYDDAARLKFEALRPEFLFCNHEKLPGDAAPLPSGTWSWALYEIDRPELAIALAKRGVEYIETMAVIPMLQALRS